MNRGRRLDQTKGVFCLETDQWHGHKDRSSVEPILHLLERLRGYQVPYQHRTVATRGELAYALEQYLNPTYSTYPVLYLAFHGYPAIDGEQSGISLADADLDLGELGAMLEGRCASRGHLLWLLFDPGHSRQAAELVPQANQGHRGLRIQGRRGLARVDRFRHALPRKHPVAVPEAARQSAPVRQGTERDRPGPVPRPGLPLGRAARLTAPRYSASSISASSFCERRFVAGAGVARASARRVRARLPDELRRGWEWREMTSG